jgi:hypothetical protein
MSSRVAARANEDSQAAYRDAVLNWLVVDCYASPTTCADTAAAVTALIA